MAKKKPALSPSQFGESFRTFMDQMSGAAPAEDDDPFFLRMLKTHFKADPASLLIVSESFRTAEHPNLHLALEGAMAEKGRKHQVVGFHVPQFYHEASLSSFISPIRSDQAPEMGPVEYTNIATGTGEPMSCVARGLYLLEDGGTPLAVLLAGKSAMPYHQKVTVEVMAADRAAAERLLAEIRSRMRAKNIYRGQVVSLALDAEHNLAVHFHRLPKIRRDQIILPDGLVERIERQTIHFARHREKLLAAGRHMKRGLLLHGPPGTGKTLSAMYLAGLMPDRTIILLTGRGLGMIEESCSMARILQPSLVVMEDVDLVASERTRPDSGCNGLLFELLNQMDGLDDDADIIFLLTTNRPDILEPALASRPGRIDIALEVPLPDEECRRRLFGLYGQGLEMKVDDLGRYIRRTDGVSAAFIRELLRKAALFAADDGDKICVADRHLDAAMHELALHGGALTRSLLGASGAAQEED